jgi:hypothetical protein
MQPVVLMRAPLMHGSLYTTACRLYDCDFNQQLELGLRNTSLRTVFDLHSLDELTGRRVELLPMSPTRLLCFVVMLFCKACVCESRRK